MPELGDLLSGPLATLGFGGMAGVVVGYAAKKLTKLLAIALGLLFITLQGLSYLEVISINWGAVQTTAQGVWARPDGATLADRAWAVLTANLPFAGGFAAGFALGFKLG